MQIAILRYGTGHSSLTSLSHRNLGELLAKIKNCLEGSTAFLSALTVRLVKDTSERMTVVLVNSNATKSSVFNYVKMGSHSLANVDPCCVCAGNSNPGNYPIDEIFYQ